MPSYLTVLPIYSSILVFTVVYATELFIYVRTSTIRLVDRLVFGGLPLPDDSTTLSEAGISGNVTIHASINDSLEIEYMDEEEDEREEEIPSSIRMNNKDDLFARAVNVRENLLHPIKHIVRREHIIEDLVEINRDREVFDVAHHMTTFTFKDEPLMDIYGVTRKVFSLFFHQLFQSYGTGHMEAFLRIDHRIMFTGFYPTVGRIICHAFILVGYFPVRLAKAAAVIMLTGNCPGDVVVDSFLKLLSQRDRSAVQQMLNGDSLTSAERDTVVRCFSAYDCYQLPTPENISSLMSEVAHSTVFCKAAFAFAQVTVGLRCYPLLWQGTTLE